MTLMLTLLPTLLQWTANDVVDAADDADAVAAADSTANAAAADDAASRRRTQCSERQPTAGVEINRGRRWWLCRDGTLWCNGG